jgi:predicted DNA-binding transcriptional regulator AlpA
MGTARSRLRQAVSALPPGSSITLTVEELLAALGESTKVEALPDQFLTVRNAARRLKVSKKWLYRHADELPYTRRVSPKVLRFSERGIEEALARQRSKR